MESTGRNQYPYEGMIMAADYGVFKEIVAISGSLMAAGGAVGLAWMRRAKWMPPEETVGGGTVKVSALICSVVLGMLYLTRDNVGLKAMLSISGLCLVLTVIALVVSIYTNTKYSFVGETYVRRKSRHPQKTRILGGYKLTVEASKIALERRMSHQKLYENANYDSDLVWTRHSRALVQVASVVGFIMLQASGSIALASLAIAFSIHR